VMDEQTKLIMFWKWHAIPAPGDETCDDCGQDLAGDAIYTAGGGCYCFEGCLHRAATKEGRDTLPAEWVTTTARTQRLRQ